MDERMAAGAGGDSVTVFESEMRPDEEIRAWMDAEIVRLGDLFRGFEVTWHNTGDYRFGQLYLWSEANHVSDSLNQPWGKGFMLCEVRDDDGNYLPTIQAEGRKLYHRLKKDYVIHRDLGR